MNRNKGFTLIELLVVIAIIGILASIVIVGLDGARKRGRDARRISDLKAMQSALEMYYDKNNQYPTAIDYRTFYTGTSRTDAWDPTISSSFAQNLSPYLTTMPKDPVNTDGDPCDSSANIHVYVYWVNYDRNKYALVGNLESNQSGVPFEIMQNCNFGNYIIKGGKW